MNFIDSFFILRTHHNLGQALHRHQASSRQVFQWEHLERTLGNWKTEDVEGLSSTLHQCWHTASPIKSFPLVSRWVHDSHHHLSVAIALMSDAVASAVWLTSHLGLSFKASCPHLILLTECSRATDYNYLHGAGSVRGRQNLSSQHMIYVQHIK